MINFVMEIIGWVFGAVGWILSTFDRLFSIMLLAVAISFMIMVKPLIDVMVRESRDDEIYEDWQDVRDALRLQGMIARRKLMSYTKKGKK